MNKYHIEYSKEARQDLIDTKKYIEHNLQEPNIAEKLIDKIKVEIDKIVENPELYAIIDDDFIKKLEIRKKVVDNYIIFYRINNKTIQIARVLYGRRDKSVITIKL